MPWTRRRWARSVPSAGHRYVRRSRPSRERTKVTASSAVRSPRRLCLVIGAPQSCDVDLAHLKHRFHDPSCFRRISVTKHPAECRWDDLPREAVLVLQPAAAVLRTALGELLPQRVDLLLRLTIHEEGDGFGERELRSSVEGHEFLPPR